MASKRPSVPPSPLPPHAQVLATKGFLTAREVERLATSLPLLPDKAFRPLVAALNDDWNDEACASLLQGIRDQIAQNREIDYERLDRWTASHPGDARAVIDCLAVDPPQEITVIRLLSRAGSQKLVFLANWQIAQREVVLKRFIGSDAFTKLIPRELQPHPLSMAHPNIIETHLLQNPHGERFLVERLLPVVLNDRWSSHGIEEAANLLRDMARALAFLQDKQLVHGDVKPDNIGFEDGRYVLLDFGICRPQDAFTTEEATATGSLRTRAPELLIGASGHTYASDVWALGATVFNAVVGRFPLFDKNESPPRLSKAEDRTAFEAVLKQRVVDEWDSRVDLSQVPDNPLRSLLSDALAREPSKRKNAAYLVKTAEGELAASLRGREKMSGAFSPSQELQQLKKYLPSTEILRLMSENQKQELKGRLQFLHTAKGLDASQQKDIVELRARLS